ncbi:hypothetical protein [Lichenibacterium ramalinae]|uniref:Uncharacterized protein n=1 Tax=Lichenibacterium ramalinae TaxID=2316527 RepID=A0A4Q2RHD2_9HYPH|nr:hypothetical protein [Lichenibacterium ramalinae]RYB06453.1 hypothetical protein D3272_06835 [Lichenibacterium ramalinae]
MGTQAEPHVWNMFKRREEGELWCAVPADTAVPRFLFSGEWDFSGQHPEPRPLPGFQRTIALQSVRMNGFYLFQKLPNAA